MTERTIFNKLDFVITAFTVPFILARWTRSLEDTQKYIKRDENLRSGYFPENIKAIEENGEETVRLTHMNRVFDSDNVSVRLTEIIRETVYYIWSCHSGIFQLEITPKLGLLARPSGVTKNNECVVMVDTYLTRCNILDRRDIEVKLLSMMAVWKAKKGVCYITRIAKTVEIDFDETRWNDILAELKEWAEVAI